MIKTGRTSIATLAASLALASPAMSQTNIQTGDSTQVSIGMLDTTITRLPGRPSNVRVVSKDFTTGEAGKWEGESAYSHGELVAASAIASARTASPKASIVLYTSNIYTPSRSDAVRFGGGRVGRGLEDATRIRLTIDYQAASKAIDWMHANGVKVVVVTATGSDGPGMRSVVERIRVNGMILVASTNNDPVRSRVYPAAYPDVISVASNDRGQPISSSPDLASYVSYVTDGRSPIGRDMPKESGSSFAAGSVAGLTAVYASDNPEASTQDAKGWLNERSPKASYSGTNITTIVINDFAGSRRTRIPTNRSIAVGPTSDRSQTLENRMMIASMDTNRDR